MPEIAGIQMMTRVVLGVLRQPSLSARALHAPVALVPGHVLLHVKALGTGILYVGATRRWVFGALDDLVEVALPGPTAIITVRFRRHTLHLPVVPVPAPTVVVMPAPFLAIPAVLHTSIAACVDAPPLAIPLPSLEDPK